MLRNLAGLSDASYKPQWEICLHEIYHLIRTVRLTDRYFNIPFPSSVYRRMGHKYLHRRSRWWPHASQLRHQSCLEKSRQIRGCSCHTIILALVRLHVHYSKSLQLPNVRVDSLAEPLLSAQSLPTSQVGPQPSSPLLPSLLFTTFPVSIDSPFAHPLVQQNLALECDPRPLSPPFLLILAAPAGLCV